MGAPMPTARTGPFTGVVGTHIYVVGGSTSSSIVNVNEIYDTATNTWSTGAPMPTPRYIGASAVVGNILYAIGGANNGQLNVVEAYNPATDTWSTKAPVPIIINSVYSAVLNNIVYLIGGFNGAGGRLTTMLSYNPATNVWSTLAPLNLGKSLSAVGVLGSTIVSAGGLANSGAVTADTEGYNAATNAWTTLAPIPTARQGSCFGVEGGLFYVAGGGAGSGGNFPVNVTEAYDLATNSWTGGLPPMPFAVGSAGSATVGGSLYCFGGSSDLGFADYVQIYQPPPSPPVISSGSIVPVYSSSTTIQSGEWASIYGSNLAPAVAVWNGDFPKKLGGTSVTVDGKPAYLWFVSPGQINFQVPDDMATGTVPVVVTTAAGSSTSTVTLAGYAPAFLLLGSKYVTAIVPTSGLGNSGGGYDLIGPAGAFSFPSRPVKAGETVELYGVGFGPTNPTVLAGQLYSGAAPSPVFPQITVGGVQAQVVFSGIVEAGLFQINVVVPNAGSGDQLLQATVGGMTTQANVFITVQ